MMAPSVDAEKNIGQDFNFESKYIEVHGSQMHYVDEGEGDVLLLVHGNPTSSYIWRNIIPTLAKTHRVVALDLIGMGKSDKPDIDYTLQEHNRYFSEFVNTLKLQNITLVLHDWGGAIGLDYARKHDSNVKQIIMMEAVVHPITWDDADIASEIIFKKLRDNKEGHELIVEENFFVEKLLPMMAGRELTEKEMNHYRAPYVKKADRKPVLVWPSEIPIDETPRRNFVDVSKNHQYLKDSSKPILFIHGEPGLIFSEKTVAKLKNDVARADFASIGEGLHYLQESQPTRISKIIAEWVNR